MTGRHTLFEAPVTVVEAGDSLAGAFCGRLLGQLGARMVKIEPPSGSALRALPPLLPAGAPADGVRGGALGEGTRSAPYVAVNAGKEVVPADLGNGPGRDLLESVLAAGGLSPQELTARFPSAIIGRVTMFGDEGPYADLIGGELQAQALGGLMNMVGEPSREPLRIGGFPAQYSTGLAMLSGFALALYRREATGRGGSFVTSVLETVANIEWKGALSYQDDGSIVSRGSDGAPAILRAQDGFFAFFCRTEDWPRVLTIMNDPRLESDEFATEQARNRNRPALLAILNECTSGMGKRDLYHKTQAYGMTTGYMATMSDLLKSEQYRAREFFTDTEANGCAAVLPGAPWRRAGEPFEGSDSESGHD